MNHLPTCRLCGQTKLPDKDFKTKDEADEWAKLNCDCPDARVYQEQKKREAERAENVQRIKDSLTEFTKFCEAREVILTDEIKDVIYNCALSTLDDIVGGANISFGRMHAKVTKNSKGKIIMKFAYSDSATAEV